MTDTEKQNRANFVWYVFLLSCGMLLVLYFLLRSDSAVAQTPPKIEWAGIDAGWRYSNKFENKLSSSYNIDWIGRNKFTYKKWTIDIDLVLPTYEWKFKPPYYSATLIYPIFKPKP